jgi:predicted RNA methylase
MKQLSDRQIMNRVYKEICGFEIPKTDMAQIKQSKGSHVYGEIKHQALNKLLSYLKLNSNDVFYDLGSGVGKVVLQTGLFTKAQKVIGVELSKSRYEDALLALNRASFFDKNISHKCNFINDDLMKVDLGQASVIYTCSTAFSETFMNQITKHLSFLSQKFKLVTLQELPSEKYFRHVDTIYLDMSWTRNTAVYIYQKI